jgi:hypothetical protein
MNVGPEEAVKATVGSTRGIKVCPVHILKSHYQRRESLSASSTSSRLISETGWTRVPSPSGSPAQYGEAVLGRYARVPVVLACCQEAAPVHSVS